MQKHKLEKLVTAADIAAVKAGSVYVMLALATTEQLREGCDFILTGPNGERVEGSYHPTTH
jgi:hypothetical protein